MQRTDDMNILLNMSLNTLNIDLMSCHCLVVISFLSLMIKVCSSKCLAARVDPKGSYVHMFDIYKTKRQIVLK